MAFVDGNTSQAVACWMGTRMSELKTLKEIIEDGVGESTGDLPYDLRAEAIKWVKAISTGEKNTFDSGEQICASEAVAVRLILMEFFNLTEEDLECQ